MCSHLYIYGLALAHHVLSVQLSFFLSDLCFLFVKNSSLRFPLFISYFSCRPSLSLPSPVTSCSFWFFLLHPPSYLSLSLSLSSYLSFFSLLLSFSFSFFFPLFLSSFSFFCSLLSPFLFRLRSCLPFPFFILFFLPLFSPSFCHLFPFFIFFFLPFFPSCSCLPFFLSCF